MEEKRLSVTCLCFLVFMSLGSSARGNTYDIPRWLRLRSDELECPQARGQFNHPRYCDFFLNCWDWRPVVGRCQQGLVFNEKIRACDYQYNVDCAGKANSQDRNPPPPPPSSNDPRCPMPFGTFANPTNCSEYFACNAGRATSYKCPKGTYYSKAHGACDRRRPEGCAGGESQGNLEESMPPPASPIIQSSTGEPETSSLPPMVNEEPQTPAPVQEIPAPVQESPGSPLATSSPPPVANEEPQTPAPIQEIQQPTPQTSSSIPPPVTQEAQTPRPIHVITGPPAETSSKPPSSDKPQKPPGIHEIPDEDIVGPLPPVAAGGTPTLAPTTVRPQTPYRPRPTFTPETLPPFEVTPSPVSTEPASLPFSPKPQFVPQKPTTVVQEMTTVTVVTTVPTERPQLPLNPKPPFRPQRPPVPETTTVSTERPREQFSPKPPFVPVTPPVPETTTILPTERPQVPYTPKPQFVPGKPQGEGTTPTWLKPSLQPPTAAFGPKPPLVPEDVENMPPPFGDTELTSQRPQAPFRPKPPFVPEDSPPPPPPSILDTTTSTAPPQEPESEAPSSPGEPSTIPNIKPKPPLMPQPDEEDEKPQLPIDINGVKPKPPFKPPASGSSPSDPRPPKPPSLNPGLFKPQKPPMDGGAFDGSSTTPPPVDGEDDPHILFPFLPKFPELFKCPVETVMLPILGDCSSLIACISGVGHRLRCPEGDAFDVVKRSCVRSKNFACPTEIPNFIGGVASVPSPDALIYAYLPVSKFTQLLKVN